MWRSESRGQDYSNAPMTYLGMDREGREVWYQHYYSNGSKYRLLPDKFEAFADDGDKKWATYLNKNFGIAIGFNKEQILVKCDDGKLRLMKPSWCKIVDK